MVGLAKIAFNYFGLNPMEVKKRLAREIVAQFYGEKAAQEAETEFEHTFQQHELPQDVPEVLVKANAPFCDR